MTLTRADRAAMTSTKRVAECRKRKIELGYKRLELMPKIEYHESLRKVDAALSTGVITPADVDRLIREGEEL